MALINCPECKIEISDKADVCPHCGYPVAKLKTSKRTVKKKVVKEHKTVSVDPRFPLLPDFLGIGRVLSLYSSDFNFEGYRRHDDNFNFDYSLTYTLKLSIHKYGLRIKEIIEDRSTYLKPKILELHFSLIINLKHSNLYEVKKCKNPENANIPLDENLICDCWSYDDLGLKLLKNQWENTPVLSFNYWDIKRERPATLVIRGSDTRISKFVTAFNIAKSNYSMGIPNIPDKKADSRYLWTLSIASIVVAGITLYVLNHYLS